MSQRSAEPHRGFERGATKESADAGRYRVLILDAAQRSALAATRSLGHKRIRIITAESTHRALASASRHSTQHLVYPSPLSEPKTFLTWMADAVQRHQITHVFPMTEITSQLLLRHPETCAPAILPFTDIDTLESLANKYQLVELAGRLNIAVPETRYFAKGSEINPNLEEHWPIVVKPTVSNHWLGDRWLPTEVHIAKSQTDLEALLAGHEYLAQHPVMLQEFIPGSGAGVFFLYNRGSKVAQFAHKRLREKPPSGGVSVLSESRVPSQTLLESSIALLNAANWHGVAMVEYRVTPEGKAYLMEVNTRFWGSLQLAIEAGVDFPWLLFQISNGNSVQEPMYHGGIRVRWLLGDLDNLILTLRDPSISLGSKIRAMARFFIPTMNTTRHEINRWDDLGPAWYELKHYVAALAR